MKKFNFRGSVGRIYCHATAFFSSHYYLRSRNGSFLSQRTLSLPSYAQLAKSLTSSNIATLTLPSHAKLPKLRLSSRPLLRADFRTRPTGSRSPGSSLSLLPNLTDRIAALLGARSPSRRTSESGRLARAACNSIGYSDGRACRAQAGSTTHPVLCGISGGRVARKAEGVLIPEETVAFDAPVLATTIPAPYFLSRLSPPADARRRNPVASPTLP